MFSLARNQLNTAALATAYSRFEQFTETHYIPFVSYTSTKYVSEKKNLFCRLNISQQKNKLNERGSSALPLKVFTWSS